ncbi:MAG: DUF4868 domain-containing protein [Colwellia sp.]
MADEQEHIENQVDAVVQIDQAVLDANLVTLKGIDLSHAVVNVYVVKTSLDNKIKRFSEIKRLSCEDDLKLQFKGYVVNGISPLEHISELRDITTNQDNRAFYVESGATDFQQAVDLIQEGGIAVISSADALNKFNSYIIQLTYGNNQQSVYAYRYVSTAWSVKNSIKGAFNLELLNNQLIAGFDEQPRFQITSSIDLIQAGDGVFVTNVKNFESAMNYEERLKERKKEAVTALCASNVITTEASYVLTSTIGTDKHLMRQLASVYSKEFYSNQDWMVKLKQAAEEAGNWLIRFDDNGNIEVDDDKAYIKELLTLLQNKRVETVVDHKVCDVDGELIALGA